MVGRPQVSQQFRFMFVGKMPHFPMQRFLPLLGLACGAVHGRYLTTTRKGGCGCSGSPENCSSPTVEGHPTDSPSPIVSAIAELSVSDREIIMLVHCDGFTLVEASRLLRLRATTARSRYHRARNRLREIVETALAADQKTSNTTRVFHDAQHGSEPSKQQPPAHENRPVSS